MDTLATIDDVRHAGNVSKRVDAETLTFYLQFSSKLMRDLLTTAVYTKALAGTLPADDIFLLKMSEALYTVGYCLPAIGTIVAEQGVLRTASVGGRGGELEAVSFVKELSLLAAHFISLAHVLIPSRYVSDARFEEGWYQVIGRVFPGLDEMPTMAPIFSYAEELLKEARGDKIFNPQGG